VERALPISPDDPPIATVRLGKVAMFPLARAAGRGN